MASSIPSLGTMYLAGVLVDPKKEPRAQLEVINSQLSAAKGRVVGSGDL